MRDLRPRVVLAFRTRHGVLGGLEHHRPDLDFTLANARSQLTAPGPLTGLEIANQFPTLGVSLGDQRRHVPGKSREYRRPALRIDSTARP
ncbi:hypothetical protein [Nonomuraea dietziae]|uniref:hypothetical protein n=1 Tax=Nonomuraea dietziae TaxID=65515 RepID=UPI0033DD2A94